MNRPKRASRHHARRSSAGSGKAARRSHGLADRTDKRRTIILMQIAFMLEAFTVAILVKTGIVAVWQIMALATLLGLASAFDIPTRQSFIVDMVGKEDLMNAIALNSSLFNA